MAGSPIDWILARVSSQAAWADLARFSGAARDFEVVFRLVAGDLAAWLARR
jgi:hypothetical protein